MPRSRLVAIYVVMGIAVAVVAILALTAGEDRSPQPSVAGGYDLASPDPCLGESFDLRQSGEFVNAENVDGTLGGGLRTDERRLTGDITCVSGDTVELEGQVASDGLAGTVDGRRFEAELTRDPPRPGPRPRAPSSIEGEYELVPRLPCLGPELVIEGSGPRSSCSGTSGSSARPATRTTAR